MLSKSDMETLSVLGYDRYTLLKLVASDMERKGKSLLALIEPVFPEGVANVTVATLAQQKARKQLGMGPAERVPAKNQPRRKPAKSLPAKPPAKELPPKPPAPAKAPAKAAVKRTLTPEARANIIAAQKKRWATYHAQKIA